MLPIVWLLAPILLAPTWYVVLVLVYTAPPGEGGGAEAESVQLPLVHSKGRWGLTSRSLMKVIRRWRKQLASCP